MTGPLNNTQTKTILYIEDDPASRALIERTLKFAGYRVILAETGLQGVDSARKEPPDLVLTDINLPDISGREVTTMLRSDTRFDKIPIVALTAQALHEQRELTMAAGITGYLTKPVDIEALPDQINGYLQGAKDHIEADRMADAQKRYTQEVVTRLEARIRELEEANETLRRLDKMKDSFIQITAHELRTPLTLVFGYSRLLQDNPGLAQDENVKTLLNGLVGATNRMQSIIDEILTVSRIMTNQVDLSIGPVNLPGIVQKVLAKYKDAMTNRDLTCHYDPSAWPGKLRADGELLTLVLDNLVSNAIKYTPDGREFYITASTTGEKIRISVRDTGIGIARDDHKRVFERFHTAGDPLLHSTSKTAFRGGGLGLGLAVCKAVVEAHGGAIHVESKGCDVEKLPGSEFVIMMPVTADNQEQASQS